MNVTNVRSGISTVLAGISGVHRYADVPDRIDAPAFVVGPPETIEPHDLFGVRAVFPVFVLVDTASGTAHATRMLDAYLASSGSSSVVAAIENDTTELGGTVHSAVWVSTEGYGGTYQFGANSYVGAVVNIEVLGD